MGKDRKSDYVSLPFGIVKQAYSGKRSSSNDETERTAFMSGVSRRSVLKAGAALLPASACAQSSGDDAPRRWIERNGARKGYGGWSVDNRCGVSASVRWFL